MEVIETFNDKQIRDLHALYQKEWWTEGRNLADTQACVERSQLCLGLIDEQGRLQGFARVLTDYTFKAFIFDLMVSAAQRNHGLGSKLVSLIKNHPTLQSVRHFELYCLPEMFEFYRKLGFSTELGEVQLMRYVRRA